MAAGRLRRDTGHYVVLIDCRLRGHKHRRSSQLPILAAG
jgi:hypothetical protein